MHRIGDKEGGEHVYGIMEVTEKHNGAERDGSEHAENPDRLMFPKYQPDEKRQSRMPREEKVSRKNEILQKIGKIDRIVRGKGSNVRKAYGNRPDQHEKRDAF